MNQTEIVNRALKALNDKRRRKIMLPGRQMFKTELIKRLAKDIGKELEK